MVETTKDKYTEDNKKVRIIYNIDQEQVVAQEVRTSGRKEILFGDSFVCKLSSLYDEPVLSYEQKRKIQLQKRWEKERENLETYIKNARDRLTREQQALNSRISYISRAATKIEKDVIERAANILCGKVKYIAEYDYHHGPKITDFEEYFLNNPSQYDKGLKLITLFGQDDGSMTFKIGEYSDGSGYNKEVFFCNTIEEAREKLTEYMKTRKQLSSNDIISAEKYEIILDKDKVIEQINREILCIESEIERSRRTVQAHENKISEDLLKCRQLKTKLSKLTLTS